MNSVARELRVRRFPCLELLGPLRRGRLVRLFHSFTGYPATVSLPGKLDKWLED